MPTYLTLIDAPTLQAALANTNETGIVAFDCRTKLGDPDWGAKAFAEGHIPGARHLDLDRHLAAPPSSEGRHPLPEPAALASHLRQEGVSQSSQVVVYDDAGGAFAARAWWCLRWLGHGAVAVLDGGLPAFTALPNAGLESGPASTVAAGDFQPRAPLTHVVTAADVMQHVQQAQADTTLLDARALARFHGAEEPIDPVAGHIPSAQCRPFSENLDNQGRFKASAKLHDELASLPQQVICYCGSGVTAAHNILALVHAGYAEPALYPGSWSGWISDPDRPIA